jgi:hypothetical protein
MRISQRHFIKEAAAIQDFIQAIINKYSLDPKNEPDLQSKYILAMNLLKKTYDRDRVRLAEKLFLRVLRSRINVEKRSDDLGNLTTIN